MKQLWIIGGGFSGDSFTDEDQLQVLDFDPKDPATNVIDYEAYADLKRVLESIAKDDGPNAWTLANDAIVRHNNGTTGKKEE